MSDAPQKDPKTGRFLPGNSGFGGRPKGSRNKLGEALLEALNEDFNVHGIKAIQDMREDDPGAYVRVIAGLLPKEFVHSSAADMSEDELDERIQQISAAIARLEAGEARARAGAVAAANGKGRKALPH